ncbi:MAG: DUF2208 domain-containing protein [Pyrodictiaceae archaeon]
MMRMLLISQLSSILFAAILAFIPQYYILIFVIYLAVMIGLNTMLQRKGVKGSKDKVLSARVLFKEEKAMEIALKDNKLMEELGAQTRMMVTSLLSLAIAFLIFWVYNLFKDIIVSRLHVVLGSMQLSYFIYWIIVFETIFLLNRLMAWRTLSSQMTQQPLLPSKYVVTERGITSMGFGGFTIEFPLPEDHELLVDERRGFVEIKLPKGRRLRFYSRNPRRLYELIKSLNEKAKRKIKTSS